MDCCPVVRTCPFTRVEFIYYEGKVFADTAGIAESPVKNWVERIGAPPDDDSLAFYMNCMGRNYFDDGPFEDEANRVYAEIHGHAISEGKVRHIESGRVYDNCVDAAEHFFHKSWRIHAFCEEKYGQLFEWVCDERTNNADS